MNALLAGTRVIFGSQIALQSVHNEGFVQVEAGGSCSTGGAGPDSIGASFRLLKVENSEDLSVTFYGDRVWLCLRNDDLLATQLITRKARKGESKDRSGNLDKGSPGRRDGAGVSVLEPTTINRRTFDAAMRPEAYTQRAQAMRGKKVNRTLNENHLKVAVWTITHPTQDYTSETRPRVPLGHLDPVCLEQEWYVMNISSSVFVSS